MPSPYLSYQMASASQIEDGENARIIEYIKTDPECINVMLGHVVKQSNVTLTKLLLNRGANVNACATSGPSKQTRPLLFLAILNDDIPMIETLLHYNCDLYAISQFNYYGMITPIELAIRSQFVDIFCILVRKHLGHHNIDDTSVELKGHNILSLVMTNLVPYPIPDEKIEMITFLLDHGANPKYRLAVGIYSTHVGGVATALEYAKNRNMNRVTNLFVNYQLEMTKGVHCP